MLGIQVEINEEENEVTLRWGTYVKYITIEEYNRRLQEEQND